MSENKMIAIIEENKLAPEQAKPLIDNFGDFFVKAHKLVAVAGMVKVTSEDQKDEMKKARELRLALREVRVEANKMRVKLKEGYLRGGNAVQAIYNDIEKITKPEEARLEQAEKFAEIKEAERKQARYEKRVAELGQYVTDTSIYQLKDMSDESYATLLSESKAAHEAKLAAEKKAQEEQVALEKKREMIRQRQIEIAPYREFLAEEITDDMSDEAYVKILDAAIKAKKAHEAEQEKIRKENEALRIQAEKDRKAKEDAELKLKQERQLQERKELEEKQRLATQKRLEEEAAAKAKAEEDERKRQQMIAPDKQKLLALATAIEGIQLPAVSSKEAGAVIRATEDMLGKVQTYIREKAKTL